MNLLPVSIVKILSEEVLTRTVRVTMETSSYGGEKIVTVGFLKQDWRTIKHQRSYMDNQPLDEHGIQFIEEMDDSEWYQRHYAASLRDFSDEEIVEEFNRRLNNALFHKITIVGKAAVKGK